METSGRFFVEGAGDLAAVPWPEKVYVALVRIIDACRVLRSSALVILLIACGSVSETFVEDSLAKEKACFGTAVDNESNRRLTEVLTCVNRIF